MKKVLLIVLLAAVCGAGVFFYMWNKPHRDVVSEKAEVSVSAAVLMKSFQDNEANANTTYLDKVIEVNGELTEVSQENGTILILKTDDDFFGISCFLDSTFTYTTPHNPGTQLSIKGRCTGFNGFEVVLTECSIN